MHWTFVGNFQQPLTLLGGQVAIQGDAALDAVAFDAIDLDRGVSTHNEDEARLNRKMCEVAERIIVVTDSSKFNRSSLHKIIDTQRIDMIIVDEGIPAESLDGLRKSGIEVVLV